MADFSLARLQSMPVTIATAGLLYCKTSRSVGQDFGKEKLNLIDLGLLPLTPIMGSGRAPLQPQEVSDAALRFAYLALTDPQDRPYQEFQSSRVRSLVTHGGQDLRIYDAVGPQTMSMVDMQKRFAYFQGNHSFRPVHIDYKNMENILNIMSLGNLNRQFVSLLRSEQDNLLKGVPYIGDPTTWDELLGADQSVRLSKLEEALEPSTRKRVPLAKFPFSTLAKLVVRNPKVVAPGVRLTAEIFVNAVAQGAFIRRRALSVKEQEALFLVKFGDDADVDAAAVHDLRLEFQRFDANSKAELDETEAIKLMKFRGAKNGAPSFKVLRQFFDEMDKDGNGHLSFLEWACLVFEKQMEPWEIASAMGTRQVRTQPEDETRERAPTPPGLNLQTRSTTTSATIMDQQPELRAPLQM